MNLILKNIHLTCLSGEKLKLSNGVSDRLQKR